MKLLLIAVGAWAALLWALGAIAVLALLAWDLVRCHRAPSPIDVGLIILGPLSLALACRLALKERRHDRLS